MPLGADWAPGNMALARCAGWSAVLVGRHSPCQTLKEEVERRGGPVPLARDEGGSTRINYL